MRKYEQKMETKNLISVEEEHILLLLQKGYSNETISKETGISVNTVKYHLKKIFRKLHAKNRIEAIYNFHKTLKNIPL
jgi:DNA-binding NarL/FixJ family response regulator